MANTTQASLILRVRDHSDADAWGQFVNVYCPLIYRYGRQNGLQDADAADLAQEVLREISRSILNFKYDPELGRFRSWLFLIARRMLGKRSRQKAPVATGDTQFQLRLNEEPGPDESDQWNNEYKLRIFHWASEQVAPEFNDTTWNAFWRTAVQGHKPADVAQELNLKIGTVYVAKNRVLRRLKEMIATIDEGLDLL